MQVLEINVPDAKIHIVKSFLKELGIKFDEITLNANTISAMKELKAGKGKKFKSVDELFSSI